MKRFLWKRFRRELQYFRRTHGHARVPRIHPDNPQLARWCQMIRNNVASLSICQLEELCRMGFDFGYFENKWLNHFFQLMKFRRKHGHARVPYEWSPHRKLSLWAARLRQRRSRVPPHRVRRLNAIGFCWNLRTPIIEKRFGELAGFKRNHGHCNVPYNWSRNLDLARWVRRQRERQNRLRPETRRHLDDMGFIWKIHEWLWEEAFRKLVAFKKQFGHYRVPALYPRDPALGHWVSRIRRDRRKLSPSQVQRLNRLGFLWRAPSARGTGRNPPHPLPKTHIQTR